MNATKRILAVALGNGGLTPDVNTKGLGAVRRPIIRRLVGCLASEHGRHLGTHYALDCLEAMDEPALQTGIANYLQPKGQGPDVVILAITTAAAKAAMAAREAAKSPKVPIVFTVVSYPGRPEYGSLVGADGRGDYITGVSTSLVQNVLHFRNEIRTCFQDAHGAPWYAYYLFYTGYTSSKLAWHEEIEGQQVEDFPIEPRHYSVTAADVGAEIRSAIKDLNPPQGRRACLLVGPSNTMFAYRDDVIATAHGPDRTIPTFFQQPECVHSTNDKTKSAVAGYGISAETIGAAAAGIIDRIFNDPEEARNIPYVAPESRELWINETIAMQLDVTLKPAGRARARVIF